MSKLANETCKLCNNVERGTESNHTPKAKQISFELELLPSLLMQWVMHKKCGFRLESYFNSCTTNYISSALICPGLNTESSFPFPVLTLHCNHFEEVISSKNPFSGIPDCTLLIATDLCQLFCQSKFSTNLFTSTIDIFLKSTAQDWTYKHFACNNWHPTQYISHKYLTSGVPRRRFWQPQILASYSVSKNCSPKFLPSY